MYSDRYIYDALYGRIQFPDYIWKNILCPELQRLREVRLCNINSLCLTGGANVNRYEHALGTAYLALECLRNGRLKVDKETEYHIVLAALLHDIGSASFGHSAQYILASGGFEHEAFYNIVNPGSNQNQDSFLYERTKVDPIYFGMPRRLRQLISDKDLKAIGQIVGGHGSYGPLINGSIDFDNIDNVYRLAYHYGLVKPGDTPLQLARMLTVEDGELIIDSSGIHLLNEWYEARKKLYNYLLLNPDEFSAKCMLEEALELAQKRSDFSITWNDVDYQILDRLSKCSYDISHIASRLMVGDLYGCIAIYSTPQIDIYRELSKFSVRHSIEQKLHKSFKDTNKNTVKNLQIAIHAISDVNKTQRQLIIKTSHGRRIEIGTPSRRILIGVFFKNTHLSSTLINPKIVDKWGVREIVEESLLREIGSFPMERLQLYTEGFNDGN